MRISGLTLSRPTWKTGIFALIALALTAHFSLGAARNFSDQPQLPDVEDALAAGPTMPEALPVPPLNHFKVIQERNVFKTAVPEATQNTSIEDLPVVQLSVKLLGTIRCDVAPFSRAVVLEGNTQRLVKEGDSLNGHVVSEIQRRALVLSKDGERKVLLIDIKDKPVGGGHMWSGI